MYFIGLFIVSWLWFYLQADKSRIRELFGAALFASFLGSLTDLLMVEFKMWSYSGLPQPGFTIPILLVFSIYPVVSYLFVQNLPDMWKRIWQRTLVWSLYAVIFEWFTLRTRHIHHLSWWNLGYSFVADIIIFLTIAAFYRYYRPAYAGSDK
jgi:hypothetical protein